MKKLLHRLLPHRAFLDRVDHHAVVRALHAAEANTSGRIRVYVSPRPAPDPVAAATRHFHRFRFFRHAERNVIFIFVAPRSRTYAVLGDGAIHGKAGDAAWQEISAVLAARFGEGRFTEGLVEAIGKAGALLKAHFPQ